MLTDSPGTVEPQVTETSPRVSEELKKIIHSSSSIKPSGMSKFLHDEWPIRKISALANDVAESFKESLYHWLPSPVASLVYGGLWCASIVSTGARVLINYQEHPKAEEKLRAGTKLLIHEGIAAVTLPVAVANITNFIQNKVYNLMKLPKTIKHLIRPIVSFITCYYSINLFDPPAKRFSSWLTGIVDDHHKKVNDHMEQLHSPHKEAL